MTRKTVIHWFRKGLRVHDNLALKNAIDLCLKNPKLSFRPIFVLDPKIIKWLKVGANRWRFLQETLVDLNNNLKKLNTRLYVIRGDYKTVFVRLFKEWDVDTITWEKDIEPYSVERDQFVSQLANNRSIIVMIESTLNCFDTELIIQKNGGRPPLTFQKYLSVASTCDPPVPVEVKTKIPSSCHPEKDKKEIENSGCYDPPTLEELEVNKDELGTHKFPGGETEALARMERSLKNTKWIREFEKPNTSPNSLEPSTTVLSPYIKFGCLSSRLFYTKIKEIYKMGKHSYPPVSLEAQIIWREFYYCVGSATANFDKMVGNSVCCQIPWDKNDKYLEAWTYGRTGYPFIDAIMRQLRLEGWIHHLARHAVACFLTRGDLWINWEEGQKVFEELLLDADWALNAGNWMWLSASAFFHQYFRVYSPVAFGQKTDKEGVYIKKYVPELKNYPAPLIYEPWKATNELQKKYGCVIGKDYPARIVRHEDIYKINLGRMKEAYAKNKLNKDPVGKRKIEDVKKESPSPKKAKKSIVQKNLLTSYFKKENL